MYKNTHFYLEIVNTKWYCNLLLSPFVNSNDDMQMRNWQAANWLCTLQLLKVITLLFIVSLPNIIYNFFQPLVINYVQIYPATSSMMTRCIGKIWKVQMVYWKNIRYKCLNHVQCHSTKVKNCHLASSLHCKWTSK